MDAEELLLIEAKTKFMQAYTAWTAAAHNPNTAYDDLQEVWLRYCHARDQWVGLPKRGGWQLENITWNHPKA